MWTSNSARAPAIGDAVDHVTVGRVLVSMVPSTAGKKSAAVTSSAAGRAATPRNSIVT